VLQPLDDCSRWKSHTYVFGMVEEYCPSWAAGFEDGTGGISSFKLEARLVLDILTIAAMPRLPHS
jgi:hypothetical protein